MKTDGHLGRCYLKGREGDAAANVILTAVGYNLRLILTWLSSLLRFILLGLCRALTVTPALKWTVRGVEFETGRAIRWSRPTSRVCLLGSLAAAQAAIRPERTMRLRLGEMYRLNRWARRRSGRENKQFPSVVSG